MTSDPPDTPPPAGYVYAGYLSRVIKPDNYLSRDGKIACLFMGKWKTNAFGQAGFDDKDRLHYAVLEGSDIHALNSPHQPHKEVIHDF